MLLNWKTHQAISCIYTHTPKSHQNLTMGRWSYLDSDEERLPEGMTRVGYDADEGVYYFRDTDGSQWKGVPGRRYGPMHRIEGPPRPPQSSSSSSTLSLSPPSSPSSQSPSSSPTIVEPYVAYYPRRPDPEFVKLWNNQGSNQLAGEDGRDNGEPSKFDEAVQGVKAWATKQINPPSRKPYRSRNPSEEKLVDHDQSSDEMSDYDPDIDAELEEKRAAPSDRERRRSRDRQRPRQKSEPTRQGQTGTLLRVGQFIGDVLSFGSGPSSRPSLNRAPTVGHKSDGRASIVRSSTGRRRNTML